MSIELTSDGKVSVRIPKKPKRIKRRNSHHICAGEGESFTLRIVRSDNTIPWGGCRASFSVAVRTDVRHLPVYDSNGNVMGLLDATTSGTLAAARIGGSTTSKISVEIASERNKWIFIDAIELAVNLSYDTRLRPTPIEVPPGIEEPWYPPNPLRNY